MNDRRRGPEEKLRILVAVDVPRPEQISHLLMELQRPLTVSLLGVYLVPDQTVPDQAREQFGPEAEEALEDVAHAFREAGVEVETDLVFTPDRLETVERTALERGCHAILLQKPAYELERLLFAVRPGPLADRIVRLLAELLEDPRLRATLLYVLEEEVDPDEARRDLEVLQRHLLEGEGVEAERVEIRVVTGEDREEAVLAAAAEHDAVVVGETDPSVRDSIFGDFARQLADATEKPVIVVRREV